MQLDIDRLVAYFGGVNALAEALKQHDPENAATTAAIYKWRTRGSLPLAQLQKLTALAEAQGRPLDLNAFLQKNESLERTEMTQTNRVIIFDTTMRDGEQSPGASMTKEEKIRIARQLEKMGVDVIEAGFAAASPGDFESVNAIAKIITKSTVCSLARAVENDVRKAGEAVSPAPNKRIHTFIATSPIHMEHKLKMKPQQVIDAAFGFGLPRQNLYGGYRSGGDYYQHSRYCRLLHPFRMVRAYQQHHQKRSQWRQSSLVDPLP